MNQQQTTAKVAKNKPALTVKIGGTKTLEHLNQDQRDVVMHRNGPVLVVAGAGTGKTRVITERIAQLINSGDATPDQLLSLTFTEKAAAEMQERLDILMPLGYQEANISTFHSFCDRILRQYGADIGLPLDYKLLHGVQQWQFLREKLFEFDLNYYRPMGNPTRFIDALVSHFSRLKEELITPAKYLDYASQLKSDASSDEEVLEADKYLELANAYQLYQTLLIENGYLDFSDLQSKVLELFERRPNVLAHLQKRYLYIMVDEYQDTNIAQNAIVDHLAASHGSLMVVGDDDQSIYKFRGAAISNILQFEAKYPKLKKLVLNQNYRSNQRILDLSYASIQHNNPDRLEIKANVDKKLKAQTAGSDDSVKLVHCSTIEQEVEYVLDEIRKGDVPLSEIAILCRANRYAEPFVEAFKRENIPYNFPSERGLYQKKEIRDLISLLRLIANPRDDISAYRVLRMPLWGIKMELIADLMQQAKKQYTSIWKRLTDKPECDFVAELLGDLIEFSKTHTVGEVLYRFTETIQLYQKLLKNGSVEAEEQIVSIATFFEKIREFEQTYSENTVIDFIAYMDLVEESGENPSASFEVEGRGGVQISTIHASKGLEFHTVFVSSLTNDRFPSRNRRDPIEMPTELIKEMVSDNDVHEQEERRLFYVAVTRAKEKLHLMHSDFYAPSMALKPRSKKPSRFLTELEGKVDLVQVEKTFDSVETFLKPKIDLEVPTAPKTEATKITQFSYSQLTTYESCPRQYQYQYIFKIPTPPSANLSFGSTMHNTLQEFYTLVGQSKQASLFEEYSPDLSLERLLAIYEDKWIDRGYESKQHRDLRKARGKEILTTFFERFKSNVPKVRFLEKGFRLKIGDYTLSGRIDRADDRDDGTLEIIDYKTGRARTEDQVKKDLQLAIYAIASQECFNIPASLLSLHFLDDDLQVSVEPNEAALTAAREKVKALADSINSSDFKPTPNQMKCQFCAYKKICDAAV